LFNGATRRETLTKNLPLRSICRVDGVLSLVLRGLLAWFLVMAFPACASAASCTISMPALVTGPIVDGLSNPGSVGNTLTIRCTPSGVSVKIGINYGIGAGSGGASNYATGPSSTKLAYQVFKDSGFTQHWGDSLGVNTMTVTTTGANQNYTAYFRAPAQSAPIPGTYTDTITIFVDDGTTRVNASVSLSISVAAWCTISISPLGFGSVSNFNVVTDTSTTFQSTCTNTTTYAVGLDAGIGTGATTSLRKMQSGPKLASYTLFRDAGRTLNWGNTAGTDTLAGTGTGSQTSQSIYARLPIQAYPSAGSYTDTVTATITY
jgi:spore coat protein U-like protein